MIHTKLLYILYERSRPPPGKYGDRGGCSHVFIIHSTALGVSFLNQAQMTTITRVFLQGRRK